mmetsp:Transcript_10185/g.18803  ORF Transcript_10185/g.18803 Transcript_10185/m.18803 type:complete len:485 (+) Transcript_10185:113-1567(+)
MRCTVSWDAWLLLLLWVSPLASAAGASYEEQNKEVTPVAASCAVRTAEDALADWVSALQTGLELHGLRANATSDEQPRRVELFQRTIKSATTAFLNRQREPVSVVLILLVVIFTPLFVALVLLNWAEEPRKQFPMPPSSPGISSIQSSVRLPVRLPPQPVFHDREDTRASGGAAAGSNLLFSNPFNRYSMADFNSSVSLPSAPALPEWSFGGGAGGGFGISNETAQEIVDAEREADIMIAEGAAEVGAGMMSFGAQMTATINSSWQSQRGSSQPLGSSQPFDLDQRWIDGLLEPLAVVQDPQGMHLRMIGSPADFQQETLLEIVRDDSQVILRVLISENANNSEILLQSVHRIPMSYMTTKYCVRQRGAKKIPRQERVAYIYDVPPVDGGLEEAIFATARPVSDCDNVIGIWTGAVASGPAWYQVRTAGLSQSNIVDRRGALIATTTAQMDSSGRQNHAFFLTAGADAAMVVMAFVAAKKCSDQ